MQNIYVQGVKLKNNITPEKSYVFSLPVVKNMTQITLAKPVTFFVGENASGKSTLLESIAINYGFNPEGGSKNFNFASSNTHSPLYKYITLSKNAKRPRDGFFLRAESFYNVASNIDELEGEDEGLLSSYGGKSLHRQSHGESFISLVANRFFGNGLYILDEPEAALSPSGQFTLLSLISKLVKKNSQFIIATHSPILMAYPNADIYVINEAGLCLTPYEKTEHYTLTKEFLNGPARFLKHLLD